VFYRILGTYKYWKIYILW